MMHDELHSNIRGHFAGLFVSFLEARGDLSARQKIKALIKQACQACRVLWDKALEWFREVARNFEAEAAASLMLDYSKRYPFLFS